MPINIKIIQAVLIISKNLRHCFYFFIYASMLFVSTLLGLWKILPFIYHIIILTLFSLLPFYYIFKYKNQFKYINYRNVIIWLEEKNFSKINPITSLFDKPISKNLDVAKWKLHQQKSLSQARKIKYYIPTININLVDPLKTRFLFLFFLAVAYFWAAKNDKIQNNIFSILNFKSDSSIKDNIISSKIWIVPPRYTKIMQKELYIDSENSKKEDNIETPINSKLKIKIKSTSKDLNFIIGKSKNSFKETSKNNFEIDYKIIENQNFIIQNDDKIIKNLNISVIPDRYPKLNFYLEPKVIGSSIKFISNASDDYRVSKVLVSILRPSEFKHFTNKAIEFDLSLEMNEKSGKIRNYFYQNLSDHIWAGHQSRIIITAFDDLNQNTKIEKKISIPSKEFINKSAKDIYFIRKEIALKNLDLKKARNSLIDIINKEGALLKNQAISKKYEEILRVFSDLKEAPFNYSHILYNYLWQLSLLLEERESFMVKKELKKAEQKFFDSLQKKDTDEIITNTAELKKKINSLIKMRNETNYQDQILNSSNEELKNKFEELNKEIKDLLSIGSKEKLNDKILQMKQLTESLRNPKKIDEREILKQEQKQNLINKLSELLNEQEIIMQDNFNMASNRGMFDQSSQGSGGKSPKEKQDSLRNSLGNIMREISSSENEIPQELGRADRAMRQASRDLENGKPDRASNAQGRASEMIQRAMNKMAASLDFKNQDVYSSGEQNDISNLNPSFTDSKSTSNDGASSGGILDMPRKYKEREAKKIVTELYTRYNNAEENIKEKKYIKKLLDWY